MSENYAYDQYNPKLHVVGFWGSLWLRIQFWRWTYVGDGVWVRK